MTKKSRTWRQLVKRVLWVDVWMLAATVVTEWLSTGRPFNGSALGGILVGSGLVLVGKGLTDWQRRRVQQLPQHSYSDAEIKAYFRQHRSSK